MQIKTENDLRPQERNGFQYDDFHETQASLTTSAKTSST
jgi:hypothetical protein